MRSQAWKATMGGAAVLCVASAPAQNYPSRPIHVLLNEPGSGLDFTARLIGPGLAASLGQPIIIDNRASIVSIETAAKAQPDGYTLLITGNSGWLLPLMRDNVSWNVLADFTPISILTGAPTLLVVHPSLPVKSVRDLIELAKVRPGELNYSAGARGSATHLAAELLNYMAGTHIVGVEYKGGAAATIAVMAGEVQLSFPTANAVGALLKSGRLKALAVTSAKPTAFLPGVPTLASSGLPGYAIVNYACLFALARTPEAVIRRLNQEIVRAIDLPDVKQRLFNTATEVVGSTPEQAVAMIKSEIATLGKLIKVAGIRA